MLGLLGKKGDYVNRRENGNGLETFLDNNMLQDRPEVTKQS